MKLVEKFLKMNKKSSIPITLLVIGVFALCTFALLTFYLSDFKISNSFIVIDLARETNHQVDEIMFYKNNGLSMDKIKDFFYVEKKKDTRLNSSVYYDSQLNQWILQKSFYDFKNSFKWGFFPLEKEFKLVEIKAVIP